MSASGTALSEVEHPSTKSNLPLGPNHFPRHRPDCREPCGTSLAPDITCLTASPALALLLSGPTLGRPPCCESPARRSRPSWWAMLIPSTTTGS
jgi:hypothetical protein